MTAQLSDLVDALEMQFDELSSFLDRETGQVETLSNDLLHEAEESGGDEGQDLPEGEEEEKDKDLWRFRPSSTFTNGRSWTIMDEFARSVQSDTIREDLLHAIRGAGAFRYFKDTLRRHRIEQTWYAFRTEALRQIAIDWCEENHIAWK